MKFGKTIQSHQVPGWGEYYLNYKALKKIINSYAAGRPASDASLLSLGLRPAKRPLPSTASPSAQPVSPTSLTSIPPLPTDLEPLPPETQPPAPGGSALLLAGEGRQMSNERGESFKAHRDVFFFTLQRELEKINAFYLIKERDLRLRLLTLLTNRKRLLAHLASSRGISSDAHASSTHHDADDALALTGPGRNGVEWSALEEGWRLFERDLGKLQGFIEINATGFRKILKKWDKRSKSSTKELYLERQVEVQPCFNREFIAKLSDIVAANLLDLENGADSHLSATEGLFADLPLESLGGDGLALDRKVDFDADPRDALANDALVDLEANLDKAMKSGEEAIVDWLKIAKARQVRDKENAKRIMRILWRAALAAPEDDLDLVLSAVHLDFGYVDGINGRTPLHQACIAGSLRLVKLCMDKAKMLIGTNDTYNRQPLHYAAMHGHPHVVSYLLEMGADLTSTDMDGHTPLMHAITQGHLAVVQIFVGDSTKASLEPTSVSNDLIPLSLACQYGHVEVARLLLQRGAKVLPNSEGLYPMHLAAKAGHEAICRLLVESGGADGGGKDRQDKYNLWTPLHHAAVGGTAAHLACIKALVQAGCDVNALDEYGKSPGWYAAWFGHVECLNFLLASGARLSDGDKSGATGAGGTSSGMVGGMENLGLAADPQMDGLSPGSDLDVDQNGEMAMEEFELIPSLSLPPPIIPLRVYGHEFLAQRCLVQLSLGHRTSRDLVPKPPPVKLYSRSTSQSTSDPTLHLWSSLKLVMTSKADMTSVPHSVILPLADEREVFTFQVANLDRFTLELSLYPTFGSKVIGRAIVLPPTFKDIKYHRGFVAPLLDHQLKVIGEVAFEVSCIRPFEGAQLEIGGRVETYWKSKVAPSSSTQDHAHQFQSHRPLSVSTSSPALRPPPSGPSTQQAPRESALVTASSLSGEYLDITVQVTKDGHAVAYPESRLPVEHLEMGISDITLAQAVSLAQSRNLTLQPPPSSSSTADWHAAVSHALTPLSTLLASIPSDMGINLQLRYVRDFDSRHQGVGKSVEVNDFVDAVLREVYDAGKRNDQAEGGGKHGRKVIFSSFDPTVCTALNWKQPNFAVFFASYCGIARDRPDDAGLIPSSREEEDDLRCLSVREAVHFAKSTNLLGVILEATTLAAVPSLVASVKDAGLLLATFGRPADVSALRSGGADGRTVDAFVTDGIMSLHI